MYCLAIQKTRYFIKETLPLDYSVYEWKQPVLTANGTLGGDTPSIKISSEVSNAYLLSGKESQSLDIHELNYWIIFYNPLPILIDKFKYFYSGSIDSIKLEGSEDGNVWEHIKITDTIKEPGISTTVIFKENIHQYKYHRVSIAVTQPTQKNRFSLTAYTETPASPEALQVSLEREILTECPEGHEDRANVIKKEINNYVISKDPTYQCYKVIDLPQKHIKRGGGDNTVLIDFGEQVSIDKLVTHDLHGWYKDKITSGEDSWYVNSEDHYPDLDIFGSDDNNSWIELAKRMQEFPTLYINKSFRYLKVIMDCGSSGYLFDFDFTVYSSKKLEISTTDNDFTEKREQFTTYTVDIKPAISQVKE